jgi:hypothetical protein
LSLPESGLEFLRDIRSPWKVRLFFLTKLPTALWWGIKVTSLSTAGASVTIPYSWRTTNPFRSIYFAALCGAGELSTGMLVALAVNCTAPVSMLVIRQQSEFHKKAKGRIHFQCQDGPIAMGAVRRAVESGTPQEFTLRTEGRDASGALVVAMAFTWSVKARVQTS